MEIAAITISIIALLVSASIAMWGWWRHRNIYEVELFSYKNKQKREELLTKLNSGKYTVLSSHLNKHSSGMGYYDDFTVLIGKIKK